MSAIETAQVLSPSQVRCFMDCHARWWFKYRLKQPDPPNGNLALGRAVHWALTQNFAQKVETYEDLPLFGVTNGDAVAPAHHGTPRRCVLFLKR